MKRFLKIIGIVVGVLAVILAGAWVWFFHMGGVRTVIMWQVDKLTGPETGLGVSIGEISGNFFDEIVVEDIIVTYTGPPRQYEMLRLERLGAGYSWRTLISGRFVFDYITLDTADLMLVKDSAAGWLVPRLGGGGTDTTEGSAGGMPEMAVDRFLVDAANFSLIRSGDTTAVEQIHIQLAFEGRDETFAVDIGRLHAELVQEDIPLNISGGDVTYSSGRLTFADLGLVSRDTRIRLDGSVTFGDTPAGTVNFATDNLDVSDISSYIGPNLKGVLDLNGDIRFEGASLDGSIDVGGTFMIAEFENLFLDFSYQDKLLKLDTLYGTILGQTAIDGSGWLDFSSKPERYRLNAQMKNFNLNELVEGTFRSDLTGHIDLQGRGLSGSSLRLNVDCELYESSFDDYPLQNASGEVIVTTDSIFFADSFEVHYYENVFYAGGTVEYSGDMDLQVVADLQNLDRYQGKLFIEELAGRALAEAQLTGKTSDPDLQVTLASDSIWIYELQADSFQAAGRLDRFLTGRQGNLEIAAVGGSAWNMPYDTIYARLGLDSNLVGIDSLATRMPDSRLMASGSFDYLAAPMRLTLDTLHATLLEREFHNRDQLRIRIDSLGFIFDTVSLANPRASFEATGRFNYDQSMQLALALNRLPIGPWLAALGKDYPIDGIVSSEIDLDGSLDEPLLGLSGRVDSLRYENLILGDLIAGISYQDRELNIDSVVVHSDSGSYRAEGYIGVNLSFTQGAIERFPDAPMDISVTASDTRFDLVPVLLPNVEELDGIFQADFELSGTPSDPNLSGSASVRNARLKYFDLVQPLFADSAVIRMENSRVIIDSLAAYVRDDSKKKNKAYAYVSGHLEFLSLDSLYYNLGIRIPQNLPFTYELDDISGRVRADLNLRGSAPPEITGGITLVEMKYRVPFTSASSTQMVDESSWDMNLNVDIPSGFWIQNQDVDAEFSGDLHVIRNSGLYRLMGELEVVRGKAYLFDKTLRLESGSRVFFEGEEGFNPQLDIRAFTRVPAVSQSGIDAASVTSQHIEVCIHVTGTLDKPEIDPCPDSDISREDIIPLLVANAYTGDSLTARSSLEQRLTGVLGAQLSQLGTRQLSTLGVETFEIDPYYSEEFDPWQTRVTVGAYATPNLYIYGRSALSFNSGQEVGFEYRFSENFRLQGSGDENQFYRLTVKLHWEF